jgi:hypothetical protein
MSKTKPKTDNLVYIEDVNFHYGLDIKYDSQNMWRDSDYHSSDCYIVNARIEKFDPIEISRRICSENSIKGIDVYFVDRIINLGNFKKEDFDIEVVGGYYGDEIGSVKLDITAEKVVLINSQINHMLALKTLKEKLFYCLDLEYNSLLPELETLYYSEETIPKDQVKFYNERYMERRVPVLDRYLKYPYVVALLIENGKDYRLIDGYHRFSAAQGKNIRAIVGRKRIKLND